MTGATGGWTNNFAHYGRSNQTMDDLIMGQLADDLGHYSPKTIEYDPEPYQRMLRQERNLKQTYQPTDAGGRMASSSRAKGKAKSSEYHGRSRQEVDGLIPRQPMNGHELPSLQTIEDSTSSEAYRRIPQQSRKLKQTHKPIDVGVDGSLGSSSRAKGRLKSSCHHTRVEFKGNDPIQVTDDILSIPSAQATENSINSEAFPHIPRQSRNLNQTRQLIGIGSSTPSPTRAREEPKSFGQHGRPKPEVDDLIRLIDDMKLIGVQAAKDSTSPEPCRRKSRQSRNLEQTHQPIDTGGRSVASSIRTKERSNISDYNEKPEPEEPDLIQLDDGMDSLNVRVTKSGTNLESYHHTRQQDHNVNATGEMIDLLTPPCWGCSKNMKMGKRGISSNIQGMEYYCENHSSRRRCHGTTEKRTRCSVFSPSKELVEDGVEWYCFKHNPRNSHLRCQMDAKNKGRQCKIICSESEIRLGDVPI
ncbi:hypothetical protein BX616_010905, partial [Lobosporangium transversale]